MLRLLTILACLSTTGCALLPDVAHQPTTHNPFPQLAKVAVAPFVNHSNEPTLDTDAVAMAYFAELQSIPGFEVVPVTTVQQVIADAGIEFHSPEDVRRLAQILKVDAVVFGVVTDYSPYYPPRLGLLVEWYAANPNYHPIPPGYSLPWGQVEEGEIPATLVFEAEMALAKEQLRTQTPQYEKLPQARVPMPPAEPISEPLPEGPPRSRLEQPETKWGEGVQQMSGEIGMEVEGGGGAAGIPDIADMPPDWPDPRGFIPPGPRPEPPASWPSDAPVIRHTRIYRGDDADFTEALTSYCYFRDDARFGGWQGYLQRMDDFVRFCCHMHIAETLTARGGAGETRVVWRWATFR